MTENMIDVAKVAEGLSSPGLGFESVETISGITYRDLSTFTICPTRGQIHYKVVEAWNRMVYPPNNKKAFMFCSGDEVGVAYDKLVERAISRGFPYILTLEDDNIPPPHALMTLLESIESNGGYDAVSGLYFTKRDHPFQPCPIVLGDPEEFNRRGFFDMKYRDIIGNIERGTLVETNVIPMGCALFRTKMFTEIQKPWFETLACSFQAGDEFVGNYVQTQDVSFCERARWAGKRFAVDCRVKVGHLDIKTGVVY